MGGALLPARDRPGPDAAPALVRPAREELGSPAIVIDLIAGESLVALARKLDPVEHPSFTERLATTIASVHNIRDTADLPANLEVPTSWDEYISGRIGRWVDAERANVAPNPLMRLIAAWLEANRPPPAPLTLVHGDFQLANVLVEQDGSFHLVDWELTHVGDPREDLGWWNLAGVTQPPDLIAADRENFLNRYRELTGLDEEQVNPATIAYFTLLLVRLRVHRRARAAGRRGQGGDDRDGGDVHVQRRRRHARRLHEEHRGVHGGHRR